MFNGVLFLKISSVGWEVLCNVIEKIDDPYLFGLYSSCERTNLKS